MKSPSTIGTKLSERDSSRLSGNSRSTAELGIHLDPTDIALIEQLQTNGRVTFEALANRTGLSRTAVRARVQALVDAGALRFTGVMHPSVYGLHAQGLVGVHVSGLALDTAEKIAAMEGTPFVSVVSGQFGVIAELQSPTLEAFAATLESIRALGGVRSLETAIYTALVKDPYAPSAEFRPLKLDDLDRQLLATLQRDGRASFADMADRVGLSPGAVRTKVLRLEAHGVVHVKGLVNLATLGLTQACSFALWVTRPVEAVSREIAAYPEVFGLATAIGCCDIVGTIVAATRSDVLETLERIRRLQGISRLESWTHLTPLKEKYERSPLLAEGSTSMQSASVTNRV